MTLEHGRTKMTDSHLYEVSVETVSNSVNQKPIPYLSFFSKKNILPFVGLVINSVANKDRSTVNYRHSLAFVRPYLSCDDHYDGWLFEEIFFLINIILIS